MSKLIAILLLVVSITTFAQKKGEVKMSARLANSAIVEVLRETASVDMESVGGGMSATPRNTATLARLPGGMAQLRYLEGEVVEFLAQLPPGATPRDLELFRMESRGSQRVVYMQAFGVQASGSPNWNTRSFRARKLEDGRWSLQPAHPPEPGEYCFSPKFNNDNFCFGVDRK